MNYTPLTIDDVDEAVETHGDPHTKDLYFKSIRPQLELTLAERVSLYRYGDLDHTNDADLYALQEVT